MWGEEEGAYAFIVIHGLRYERKIQSITSMLHTHRLILMILTEIYETTNLSVLGPDFVPRSPTTRLDHISMTRNDSIPFGRHDRC